MTSSVRRSPVFDITLRVGCHLIYEVTGRATLLLNVQPLRDRQHLVLSENLSLGPNLPAEEFVDSHGNHVFRLDLRPGTNVIKHDAIVSVSSKPDNHDLSDKRAIPVE